MATKKFSIGTTEEVFANREARRTMLGIANNHSTAIVEVSDEQGSAGKGEGFTVFPKTSLILELNDGSELSKKWWVRSDTVSTDVRRLTQYKIAAPVTGPEEDIQDPKAVKDPYM